MAVCEEEYLLFGETLCIAEEVKIELDVGSERAGQRVGRLHSNFKYRRVQ